VPERYASLKQGLVGCWIPSVSGSGFLLPDLSGRGNNGVLTNMASDDWVSSQYGRALDFDGTNDYVAASDRNCPSGDITATLSCWVNLKASSPSGGIFRFGNSQVAFGQMGFYINLRATRGLSVEFAGNNPAIGPSLDLNRWTHIAATKTPGAINTTTTIFVDGVSYSPAGGSSTSTPSVSLSAVLIGLNDPSSNDFSPVILDDIRIYNRALSASEIRILASRPGIGLRQEQHRQTFYQFPSGSRRRLLLTGQT